MKTGSTSSRREPIASLLFNAARTDQYQGVRFQRPGRESVSSRRDPVLAPSMFTFMGRLHELTEGLKLEPGSDYGHGTQTP